MPLSAWIAWTTATGTVGILLATGLSVYPGEVIQSLRDPFRVSASLLVNFGVVPAITLLLLAWVDPVPAVAAGFLISAATPGAPVGPPMVAMGRGDVPWAVGQMVLLATVGTLASPLLLPFLLRRTPEFTSGTIDPVSIGVTLVSVQFLPLILGMTLRGRCPTWADWLVKPVKKTANLLFVVALLLILWQEGWVLLAIRSRGWAAMGLLASLSLAAGWVAGGWDRRARVASAVMAGPRNAAVGLVIASTSLAAPAARSAIVAYALVSILMGLLFAWWAARQSALEPQRVVTVSA